MIVPQYWAESKVKKVVNGRQFTIKRFGWSDVSEDEAKVNADIRLKEALAELESRGSVRRVDHKVPYNGAEGIPIREEVVARYGDVVISRNSYGALCLNVSDVLFADIDFESEVPFSITMISFFLLSLPSVLVAFKMNSWGWLLGLLFTAFILTPSIADMMNRCFLRFTGGHEKKALENIHRMSLENPDLHIRLYKTPLGFRILLMNDVYVPGTDASISIMQRFNSDRQYIQMCKNQNCFRARVSPKPWRMGIERIGPRPGVWPISPDRLEERVRWVKKYEESCRGYASCHFVMRLGSDKVHERAEYVRRIHDERCKVHHSDLKIA